MSKEKFTELLRDEPPVGAVETVREIAGQLWDAAKPMFDHGRAEAASALFSGNAHVVYGWGSNDNAQEQVQAPEVPNTPEPVPEQDRGGREM